MDHEHIQTIGSIPADPLRDLPAYPETKWGSQLTSDENPTAMRVFIAWEKLRLVYNFVLSVFSVLILLLSGQELFVNSPFLLQYAVVANVCYCVGPVAEGYLCLIQADRLLARALLFLLGTLLSIALAVVCLCPVFILF